MSSNEKDILENIRQQLKNKIYFYSSRDEGCGFLSNFYPCQMIIDGKTYYHTEGYYQASKFIDDEIISESIRKEINPLICKNIASGYTMTDSKYIEWNSKLKVVVMKQAVLTKFVSNSILRNHLLNTGTAELVEDSHTDYYWGCGKDGTGENMLGVILMEVRTILRTMFITS